MIRGTTPTHTFTLPFDTSLLSDLYITYRQKINLGKEIVLEKSLADCKINGDKVILKLTQEDTLMFVQSAKTEIQVRVKTIDGEALASQIFKEDTAEILKDGVI